MKKLELDYVSYFERKMYRTPQLNIICKPIRMYSTPEGGKE